MANNNIDNLTLNTGNYYLLTQHYIPHSSTKIDKTNHELNLERPISLTSDPLSNIAPYLTSKESMLSSLQLNATASFATQSLKLSVWLGARVQSSEVKRKNEKSSPLSSLSSLPA